MKIDINSHYAELEAYGIDSGIINDGHNAEAVSSLFNSAKPARFAPQQHIYQEGLKADTIYHIKKGMVKLVSYLPNGKARIVRLLGQGKLLGLDGIVNQNYEHTAIAVNQVELLKIPTYMLNRIKSQDPEKFFLVGEQWYDYLRAADTWITQFSTGSIRARVARLVTFLSYIESETDHNQVELLNVEEMAAVLGVTPESVSRVLADFKRRHALERMSDSDGYHYTRNCELLQEFAQDH